MIALFVPAHPGDPGRTMRAELRVFRIPQVWFTLALGAIGFGGFFALYSYVAPMVTDVAHAPEWVVPIVLVLMGVGMTIGNIIGGYLADINLRRTLLGGLLSIVLAVGNLLTVLVVVLVAAAGGGQYVFGFVGDQTTRSLQIESPVSSMRRSSASNGPSTTLRSRPEGLACTLRSARADVHGVGCERGRRNDSTGVDPGRTILL
ncbi:hypothetical protein [Ralstonia pickettii]|uniref:hypothetical protein n=1 Tax=Ralstonia pickettii TaxID=329 RepID=UPI0021566D1D